jgi:hypothetical protein
MLQLDWFYQSPIDFEHKNYLLLQYLKSVDDSYSQHILSPYLLWTEKLVKELKDFNNKVNEIESNIKKEIKFIDFSKMQIIREEVNKNNEIKIILEVVEYSTPILESKVKLGYKLLDKYPQILYLSI